MFRYTFIDREGRLMCDVSEYVRRHNVVYETPATRPQDGLPLGNGFMGGLVYHTDKALCMRVCRTDSFDYCRKSGRFGAWAHEWEEECTTLAGCGLVSISDGTPAFAWEYLDDYDMTLDLGRAEIGLRSKTPFSQYAARGYGSLLDKVVAWEVEASSEEPLSRTISLERYGTRGFFHYYESFTRDTSRRLYDIAARAEDDCALVTQRLNGCTFTTAIRAACEGARYEVLNSREARCVLPAAKRAAFTVYITTALSTAGEDTEAMAVEQLRRAAARGDAVYADHLSWWKDYWNRSFIHIRDDFAENFYYINRYQFGCSGFGAFPPSVFGSLWTAFGDTRNWGHFYHWNDQMQFWPCDAWNHGELLAGYFDFRRKMLPKAVEDGRAVHGVDGAWYSDIASAEGDQAVEPDTRGNMTCGAMIALQMYRHYKHFPDAAFLRDTAYPVMKACGDLYVNLLREGGDHRYHIRDVTAMEGFLYLDDTLSDWAMARALFRALLDVADAAGADEGLREVWRERLENLYEPPTAEQDGRRVFAYGRRADGSACTGGVYPESDMAVGSVGALMGIYPASLYGRYTAREPYQSVMSDTMASFKGHLPGLGWDPIAVCLARFGLGEELEACIRESLQRYCVFPNGLAHFNPPDCEGRYSARPIVPGTEHTPWGELHEKDRGERVSYDAARFAHFYSEPEGVVCTAINESLLQSWEGVIRVFPAAGDGVFRLHAEGDFMVASQKTDGRVRFVSIESRRGGPVTLQSPFEGDECVRSGLDERPAGVANEEGQRLIRFDTEPGRTYVVFSRADHIDGSYPTAVPLAINRGPKSCGGRVIGRKRDF